MKKIIALMALAPMTILAATNSDNISNTELKSSKSNNSTSNREGKSFMATAEILGISSMTSSQSIEGSYYFTSNILGNLRYTNLQKGLTSSSSSSDSDFNNSTGSKEADRLWEEAGGGYMISAGVKHFVGNSFYYKPEVFYRKQRLVTETTNNSARLISATAGDYTDIGLSIKIGNQWQWENYTLGCDWVGLNQTASVVDINGTLERDDLPTFTALNFYMGASF